MSSDFTDQPDMNKRISNQPGKPGRAMPGEPASFGSEGLGSLAQVARLKKLNQARGVLIAVGVLTLGVNLFMMAIFENQIKAEIAKAGPNFQVDQKALAQIRTLNYLIFGLFALLGVVFLVLAALVKAYPLPTTISALILYIGANLLSVILMLIFNKDEAASGAIASGAVVKVFIVVVLIASVRAAYAYENDKSLAVDTMTPIEVMDDDDR